MCGWSSSGRLQEIFALASEDSLSEVLSNLIVNAIGGAAGGRARAGESGADGWAAGNHCG